jgi:hypothetical protein
MLVLIAGWGQDKFLIFVDALKQLLEYSQTREDSFSNRHISCMAGNKPLTD